MNGSRFSSKLQCEWERIECPENGTLTIYFPSGNVPDMNGCIDFATGIYPRVSAINTVVGGDLDTSYELCNGTWEAFDISPGKAA